jgi:uncharacterized protein YjbI with pentapeptide repeats
MPDRCLLAFTREPFDGRLPEMISEILTGIQVLRSLVEAGMSTSDAWKEEGFGKDEVSALGKLHSAAEGLWKLKKQEVPELGALHLATITRCFGQALKRYQDYIDLRAPSALFKSETGQAEQQTDSEYLTRLLKGAAKVRIEPGLMPVDRPEIDLVESLTGNPLATPYYQFLWNAFFKPADGEQPLMKLEAGGVLEFERYFVLAWGEAMTAPTGERLRQYLERLQRDYKPRLIQQVLISDMAGWGSRHTFGNLMRGASRGDSQLPFMPLEEMYVQPFAREAGKEEDPGGPVLERLEQLLRKNKIVILQADFGMGKSLTSRTLACLRARKFREPDEPTLGLELPVHVRCVEDLRSHDLSVQGAVQRAYQRQAAALGYPLDVDDKALAYPSQEQRALFLLDGLDEVDLGESGLKTFFENVRDKARAANRHRFVVFSRPGVVPLRREVHALEGVPILELLPWKKEQVDEWLGRWRSIRGHGPTWEEIAGQRLDALAATPILLLMIAHTWDPMNQGRSISRAELYERFFQNIARGKHEDDKDNHPAIFHASGKLHEHLINRGLIERNASEPDAMLWLMSRVAWEAVRLEHRDQDPSAEPESLATRHIESLLYDELKFRGDKTVIDCVRVGLLLTLQANLHSGSASQILFGHKSFREFLVARYWADRLRILAREQNKRDVIEKSLLGAPLLGWEDESFDFLVEMLNAGASPSQERSSGQSFGLGAQERERLFQWAEERFQDERMMGKEGQPESLRDDLSSWLRMAALAIGSHLYAGKGVSQRDVRTLRSLFASSWLMGVRSFIRAPLARLPRARLSRLDLSGADLSGANLSEAFLDGAFLRFISLCGANLSGANLSGADIGYSDLNKADLNKADLSGADLSGANLSGANLSEADLSGANLSEADLSGANLSGANLDEIDLWHARYDTQTIWGDFDPEAEGANLLDDEEEVDTSEKSC